MSFTPPMRKVSDAENKLRLLYCVRALQQVAEAQLWPFVASLDLMEYIPMQLFTHELLSGGDLVLGEQALSGTISLTPKGQETLGLFAHRIMASDRERIDRAAPAYRAQIAKRRHIRAVYESAREGDYRMLFSLSDGVLPTLELRMETASREYATRSLRLFEEKAAAILIYLYGLDLSWPESAGAAPLAEPTVTTHSPQEHAITTAFSVDGAAFVLMLLLPSRQDAVRFGWLLASPLWQGEVAGRIFSLLCKEEEPHP